jgi:DMSO/TMAO reductase YedYZ molybdopterin-dependent catalytic subunit
VAAVFGGAGRFVIGLRTRPEDVALPEPTNRLATLPAGLEEQYSGITPLRIDNADFYRVDTRPPGDTPIVSTDGWTLTVDGDVENELEISFEELLEMPMVERDITLTCVSNSVGGEFVGGARWQGVLLKDVLDMAGVGGDADQILSTDFDGMTISTPLDLATDGRDAMIVVGMNGEQLPRAHGFPVRMIVPGLYGFISATKWLTKLTLTTYADQEAYWTDRKWATDAPIKPSARIDTPRALDTVSGETIIGGVAWAQNDGGVGTVQVQIDSGGWQDAELGPDVGNVYWRQWFYRWTDVEAGQHTLKARVVDADGDVQSDVRAEPFPEGSSGIHSIFVTAE